MTKRPSALLRVGLTRKHNSLVPSEDSALLFASNRPHVFPTILPSVWACSVHRASTGWLGDPAGVDLQLPARGIPSSAVGPSCPGSERTPPATHSCPIPVPSQLLPSNVRLCPLPHFSLTRLMMKTITPKSYGLKYHVTVTNHERIAEIKELFSSFVHYLPRIHEKLALLQDPVTF